MNDNIIKQPPLPNAIQFHTRQNDDMTEVLRITREGVWVNPDMQADETAKAVLDALSSQVRVLVQRAVEKEREKVAKWMMEQGYATGHGDSVIDLLKELEWQAVEREREACARVVEADGLARGDEGLVLIKAAGRIRARGEK